VISHTSAHTAFAKQSGARLFASGWASAITLFLLATNLSAAPAISQSSTQPTGPVIYKLVDASGRITYTNAPTKGATKVELDPITVIPSSPAGMLGGGQAPASGSAQSTPASELIPVGIAASIAKPEAPTMPLLPIASPGVQPTFAASARGANVQPITAIVTPVATVIAPRAQPTPARVTEQSADRLLPTPAISETKLPVVKLSPRDAAPGDIGIRPVADAPLIAATAPAIPPAQIVVSNNDRPIAVASPAPTNVAVASIRDQEIPAQAKVAPPLASPPLKFEKEEQQLAALKVQLADKQNESASFRAMRARLPTTIDQTDPAKAAVQNELKAQVEQHFERIRSLQDQIAQREQNLAVLRQ
jgi:hypothetical protein